MFWCFFLKQKTASEMGISDWSSDVCSSDLDCLEKLLDLGADMEARDNIGATALHCAVKNDNWKDCITILLHAGCQFDEDDRGRSVLFWATVDDRKSVV